MSVSRIILLSAVLVALVLGGALMVVFLARPPVPVPGPKERVQDGIPAPEYERMRLIAEGDLGAARSEIERFYALCAASKRAMKAGKQDEAAALAGELARLAPQHRDDWNYGNAIQDSNQVLGRIALAKGDVEEAKRRLLASAESDGSPQMNSFGPNMRLAKELLEKGERDVVLDYFHRCGRFWKMGADRLAAWEGKVKVGEIPEFGPNLEY